MPAIRMMAQDSGVTDSLSSDSGFTSTPPSHLASPSTSNGIKSPTESEPNNEIKSEAYVNEIKNKDDINKTKNEESDIEVKNETEKNQENDEGDEGEYEEAEPEGIITRVMVCEEEKGHKESDEKVEKLRQQFENEAHNKEIEEKKFQRLQGLLQRSQFYSNFALKKLDQLKTTHHGKCKSEGNLKARKRPASNNAKTPQKPRKSSKTSSSSKVDEIVEDLSENDESCKGDLLSGMSLSQSTDHGATRVTSLGLTVAASQPHLLIGGALRDYQLEGLNWLKMLFLGGMNGILADEMGLGKTIQIISLICHLYEEKVGGPFLIVAPLSTLPNWIQEFETFAPDIPVILFHGDKVKRKQLGTDIKRHYQLSGMSVKPVVVTSYQIPLMETAFLGAIRWKYIIVDEGHRLKNHNTLLARCLSGFKSINRMILTGTPLQNNLYELWSLLNFLMPEVRVASLRFA